MSFLPRFLVIFVMNICLVSHTQAQTTNALPQELSQAEKLLSANRPADAIRILEPLALRYQQGDVGIRILVKLHDAYVQAKRPKDADRVEQQILTRFAGHPLSEPFQWNAIGKAGSSDEQIQLLKDYVRLFPGGPHVAAAQEQLQEMQTETTMKKLQDAPPLALRQAAEEFYNRRQFADALKLYERLQKEAPLKDCASFRIAFCHWWLHDYDKAVTGWTELADQMPQSPYAPEALQMAGRTCTGPLHDGDRALRLFARITKHYPTSSEAEPAAYSIAILNYWMKRKAEARKAFKDFLQSYPNSVYAPAAQKILSEL